MLTVTNIQIPYSRKKALPPFSFSLEKPTLLFVTGANGVGKSTLLKQLSGLYPSHSVLIKGQTLQAYTLKERAKLIGLLEQTHNISFPILVKDLVVMGRYNNQASLSHYSEEDYESVYSALQELGIEDLYENNFLTLSGGEQQLCLLAQLSVQNPVYILLDEPTQNLDLYYKEKVFNWMSNKVVEMSKTIICVTHDLHWISEFDGQLINLNPSNISMEKLTKDRVSKTITFLRTSSY